MFKTAITVPLLASSALLPIALGQADFKGVSVKFPDGTSSEYENDPATREKDAHVRDFPFTKAGGDGQKLYFQWYGSEVSDGVYAWVQTCDLWADEGFDEQLDFTLRKEKAGFAGKKDGKAHIRCGKAECHIGACEGENVIPFVDSTV